MVVFAMILYDDGAVELRRLWMIVLELELRRLWTDDEDDGERIGRPQLVDRSEMMQWID